MWKNNVEFCSKTKRETGKYCLLSPREGSIIFTGPKVPLPYIFFHLPGLSPFIFWHLISPLVWPIILLYQSNTSYRCFPGVIVSIFLGFIRQAPENIEFPIISWDFEDTAHNKIYFISKRPLKSFTFLHTTPRYIRGVRLDPKDGESITGKILVFTNVFQDQAPKLAKEGRTLITFNHPAKGNIHKGAQGIGSWAKDVRIEEKSVLWENDLLSASVIVKPSKSCPRVESLSLSSFMGSAPRLHKQSCSCPCRGWPHCDQLG